MDTRRKFRLLWGIETAVFVAILAGIVSLNAEAASDLWLYELVGAVSAAMITTFGIYKMKQLT